MYLQLYKLVQCITVKPNRFSITSSLPPTSTTPLSTIQQQTTMLSLSSPTTTTTIATTVTFNYSQNLSQPNIIQFLKPFKRG